MPEKAKELVTYFENTYIGSTKRIESKLRKIAALYSPSVWNVMETTLRDGNRTNNQCEGWKHRFSNLVST